MENYPVREPRGWVDYADFQGTEIVSGKCCVEASVKGDDDGFLIEIHIGRETFFGGLLPTLSAAKVKAEELARRRCWNVIEGGYR